MALKRQMAQSASILARETFKIMKEQKKEKLEFLQRVEVKTMQKDLAKLREAEAKKEIERISGLKTSEEKVKERLEKIKKEELEAKRKAIEATQKKAVAEEEKELAPEPESIERSNPPEEEKNKLRVRGADIENRLILLIKKRPPLEARRKQLVEELEKIKKELEPILEKEKEIEESKEAEESREKLAANPEEKRKIEKERWEIEAARKQKENEKWSMEDRIEGTENQIKECDLDFQKISEQEEELKNEQLFISEKKKELELEEKKEDFKIKINEVYRELEPLKKELAKFSQEKSGVREYLIKVSIKENEIEQKIRNLEKLEKSTATLSEKRKTEEERWRTEEERRKLEEERWKLEANRERIDSQEKDFSLKHKQLSKEAQELKKEIADINSLLEKTKEESLAIAGKIKKTEPEIAEEVKEEEGVTTPETIPGEEGGPAPEQEQESEIWPGKTEPPRGDEPRSAKPSGPPQPEEELSEKQKEILEKIKKGLAERAREKGEETQQETEEVQEEENLPLKPPPPPPPPPMPKELEAEKKAIEEIRKKAQEIRQEREETKFKEKDFFKKETRIVPKRLSFFEKITIRLILILFLVAAIGLIFTFWYWYFIVRGKTTPLIPPPEATETEKTSEQLETVSPAIFKTDATRTIEITSREQSPELLQEALKENFEEDSFARILIKDAKENRILGLKEFFETLKVKTPENFYNKIDDNLTLFIYSSKGVNRLGFAAKINEKEGFNDLISSWEKTLEQDTDKLFLTLGKTSPAVPVFKETVYKNKIIRYLSFPSGNFGICWTTTDRYFIFTSSGESMIKAIDRIEGGVSE